MKMKQKRVTRAPRVTKQPTFCPTCHSSIADCECDAKRQGHSGPERIARMEEEGGDFNEEGN